MRYFVVQRLLPCEPAAERVVEPRRGGLDMGAPVRFLVVASLSVSLLAGRWLAAQDDVADIVSQDLRAGKDEHKRYFLIEPPKSVKAPRKGYGLLLVLPGGDGSANFHPFTKRIYKNAVPEGYVLAQPVAVKWTEKQQIVWPTDKNRVEGMKFSTEQFVEDVIKDVAGTRSTRSAPLRSRGRRAAPPPTPPP